MKFTLRYWWQIFKNVFRPSLSYLGIVIFALILCIDTFVVHGFSLVTLGVFLGSLVVGFLLYLILLAILAALLIQHKRKYYEIVDKKGYCMEAFNYFQQHYILGKPVNEYDYIEFAELYQKLGDYDSAIKVMNSIKVPESNRFTRAVYIFEYMTIAALKNDTALVDDIWRQNQNFINSVINDPKSGASTNALYLVMIYADCVAGRYERGLQICNDFLSSNHIRKYNTYKENFLVMKIFLLKKLGREAELNNAVLEFNDYVAKEWEPLVEASRTELRRDAEKAIRGELPL